LWIGSFGVALLLLAFVLNLLRWLHERSRPYLIMNFVGAGLAGWYAWTSGIIPFVILEGVWSLTALVRLIMAPTKSPRAAGG
jgi:hypothetical protein